TVLLTGESGTGKEVVARSVHDFSIRKDKPFIAINCGAIPETLLESELFGHVKGAFTDASRTKRGLIEEANKGTLFLDEIGELPVMLQVKLLRFLQEEEIRPIGSNKSLKVDVRIVAATARNLVEMVEDGTFREDLYYRLNVLHFHVPPLRERRDDIPLLVTHFRRKYAPRLGLASMDISKGALRTLVEYHWPGNVRELENTVERAMVFSETGRIEEDNLPEKVRTQRERPALSFLGDRLSILYTTAVIEDELIQRALKQTGGNRTKASVLLEISHRALLYKIREYAIPAEDIQKALDDAKGAEGVACKALDISRRVLVFRTRNYS
ncbi:sigma 54-interacting transcriptional regulator, partial [Myxococcota bacterium]|nr:sigma 54-interacting transcriptional regulator [Myxococcota bacterium]